MPVLKSLTFTAIPRPGSDPVANRRAKLVIRLEEQRALFRDPSYTRSVQRTVKENGEKKVVEKKQRVKPWWRTQPSGGIIMTVHYGTRPIEFEKGKSGIAVQSKEKLETLLEALIGAAQAGEFDEILKGLSKSRQGVKASRAA